MADMAKTMILPAVEAYAADIAKTAAAKKAILPDLSCAYESSLLKKLSEKIDEIAACTEELEKAIPEMDGMEDAILEAEKIRDTLLPKMSELRVPCDEAETMTAKKYWPFPTYADLMFSGK